MNLVSIDGDRLRELDAAALVNARDDLHGWKLVARVVREVAPNVSRELDAREHLVIGMMRNDGVFEGPDLKLNRVRPGRAGAVDDLARERRVALVRARHFGNDVCSVHLFSRG